MALRFLRKQTLNTLENFDKTQAYNWPNYIEEKADPTGPLL